MQPDDVRRELDQLSGQRGQPVGMPLAIAIVEEDGLPLHIAEVAEPLLEGKDARGKTRLRGGFQHTDPRDVPPRLRCGGERCASRLRVSVAMNPTALCHIVISLSQSYADGLLSIAAET
jgi:hypothetical protein